MNVKKITPVLLVNEIEPILPFWIDRLGFAKTIEVPDGNKLAFVAFQKGCVEVMYQTYASVEHDAPTCHGRRCQKRSHVSLLGSRQPGRRPSRHERRAKSHARAHRLLRHARIRRPRSSRPLHHLRPPS